MIKIGKTFQEFRLWVAQNCDPGSSLHQYTWAKHMWECARNNKTVFVNNDGYEAVWIDGELYIG